ncbi:MAG TPA: Ig-like domain-containing protein [Terriglobales bacterium]|nr:Ig-like domain-containing protein [Terriglobales bacterium]
MHRNWSFAAVTLILVALCGCGGKNGLVGGGQGNSIFLKSIAMTPANPTVALTVAPQSPATTQFVVIGQYNVGSPKDITSQMTWISLDTKVATLDSKGTATAVGSGRVIVTAQIFEPATQKTLQASTVLSVVPQLTSITVSPASAQIAKDTAQQFTAAGKYNDGTQADVTALVGWSSSQPATATVSSSPGTQGRAFAVASGSSDITASLGALSSSAALTVTNANLTSVAVAPKGSTISLANAQQFKATGAFDDGTTQDITATAAWASSDRSIAHVTSAGLVTGKGIGNAVITASAGGFADTANTSVDASSVASVAILPVAKIANGTRLQMRAAAVLKDGSSLEVTSTPGIAWISSNPAIATVGSNGFVASVSPGLTTISAKLGNQTGSASLQISDATIQSLAVAPNQATIGLGATQNIVALAIFNDSTGNFQQDLSNSAAWSSDNTAVATVAFAKGLQEWVTANATGTANVSATFSDGHGKAVTGSAVLNVSSATLSGISVTPGNTGVTLGGGKQLIATGTYSDGTAQDLTIAADWNSASGAVAEVTPFGFALAGSPGQTSVVAAFGFQTGASAVVVNPGAVVKIDICAATVSDPLNNCPPLDPQTPVPPISFAKAVPYGLVALATFADGSRADLTGSARWTSSNPSAVSVSDDPAIPGLVTGIPYQGSVTGLVAGHVTITATAGGVSGSADVIVTDATPAFLTVTPPNGAVHLGFPQQMTVVATFSDSTTQDVTPYVTWSTSDPTIAVVYPGGLAYSSGIGPATLTATLSGISGSTTLTVQ